MHNFIYIFDKKKEYHKKMCVNNQTFQQLKNIILVYSFECIAIFR